MDLHVLSEGAGVRVGLVAHFAEIGLVGSVHMHVLFAVAAVCKAPVTALELTLKWFFTYCRGKGGGRERDLIKQGRLDRSLSPHRRTEPRAPFQTLATF